MNTVQALLVDFDGTIADTGVANYVAYARALSEVGVAIGRQSFDGVADGRNWRQFLPELLAAAGVKSDPAAIARRKTELYPGCFGLININEALVQLLRLSKANCRIALVTTASGVNVRAILDHFELGALFDLIITGDDVTRHKPAPDAYELAARQLGCVARECLVIEDSCIGVAAGHAFGSPVLRVRF
jgi:beta-phosphoglucomutase-like phosphatase (HAD superfamily)